MNFWGVPNVLLNNISQRGRVTKKSMKNIEFFNCLYFVQQHCIYIYIWSISVLYIHLYIHTYVWTWAFLPVLTLSRRQSVLGKTYPLQVVSPREGSPLASTFHGPLYPCLLFLDVSTYVCIYIYIYIPVHIIYMCVRIYIYVQICVYICIHTYVLYIHLCIYTYVCVYVCIYICIICRYVLYAYIYAYI